MVKATDAVHAQAEKELAERALDAAMSEFARNWAPKDRDVLGEWFADFNNLVRRVYVEAVRPYERILSAAVSDATRNVEFPLTNPTGTHLWRTCPCESCVAYRATHAAATKKLQGD